MSPDKFTNSKVDNHPNVAGSQVFAVLLSEQLARAGLLGSPDRPRSLERAPALP